MQEILERNVELYKEETSFVPYLIELAVYLLEFEYDWKDVDGSPGDKNPARTPSQSPTPYIIPESSGSAAADRMAAVSPPKSIAATPQVTPLMEDSERRIDRIISGGGKKKESAQHTCPTCGAEAGTDSLCPQCHTLLH